MSEKDYNLGEPIRWKVLSAFIIQCNTILGRQAITSAGSDGLITGLNLSQTDLSTIIAVNHYYDTLDRWDISKLRSLTLEQLNNEITTRQNEINTCTTLTQAKTALLNLLADDAKVWRIILWMLKREMNQL